MSATPLDPLTVDLSGTNLIEASAGTGKTYTITTLFVRMVLELELDVDQILVVTFTRAATAELRDRVRRRLGDVLAALQGRDLPQDTTLRTLVDRRSQVGQLDRDCRRLDAAMRSLDGAAIFTIHGFCQRMLHDNAFESGVEFDAELVTDLGPAIRTCVHDFWGRTMYDLPPEVVTHLRATARSRTGVSLKSLRALARKAIRHRDLAVVPEPRPRPTRVDSVADLDAWLRWLEHEQVAWARTTVAARMAEAGLQSYDDLLVRLRDALRADQTKALGRRMAQCYRAVLIDEFQDTDPVQYEIFRAAFHANKVPLFLIGDPKQAIYSFRGADLFAYLAAVADAGANRFTLGTNFRSDATLVGAVNTLFARVRRPFALDEIDFTEVQAAQQAPRLHHPEPGHPGLEILFLPRQRLWSARGGFIAKQKVERALPRLVAAQIVELLTSGASIDGNAIQPGDVAVLCRKNKEARLMEEALRDVGVPGVVHSEASVFDSAEAEEIERIARALAEPGNTAAFRAALATPTVGKSLNDLHALQDDVVRHRDLIELFRRLAEIFARQGFIPALRRLLAELAIERRLLGYRDGERSLTNLLHLSELMQAAATHEHLGPVALCHWLQRMRRDPSARTSNLAEAAQLRLESDALAVQLVTVHKSKGLEYPVVYCPYLWDGRLLMGDDERWITFHDPEDGHRLKLDLGSEQRAAHLQQARFEALAESLRLMYVALTRARHRCSVVWGGFNEAGFSPLAYTLHQSQDDSAQDDSAQDDSVQDDSAGDDSDRVDNGQGDSGQALMLATAARFKRSGDDAAMLADLQALVAAAEGGIKLTVLDPDQVAAPFHPSQPSRQQLDLRTVDHRPAQGFAVSSFTALTASQLADPYVAGDDHDLDATTPGLPPAAVAVRPDQEVVPLSGAGRGAAFGRFIHKIFEVIDFQHTGFGDIEALAQRLSLGAHRGPGALDQIARAVVQVLDTPLPQVEPGFCLRALPAAHRLNEMEFHLAVAPAGHGDAQGSLRAADLAAVFTRAASNKRVRAYASRLAAIDFAPLCGFLKGIVDLVFVHAGRWFVVDYKSNDLGPYSADYAQDRLAQSMSMHHYYLQYHLYALALHRHLGRRLKGYSYASHFGGVYYLFVRGMSPDAPLDRGVYFDRPSAELVHGLDALFAGAASQGTEA